MGLLDRFKKIKEGLSRTRTNFVDKISKIITGKTKIDDELIDEIEEALLSADVGFTATEKIVGDIRARVKAEGYEDSGVLRVLLKEEIAKYLMEANGAEQAGPAPPHVVMIVGVNGVGKTTTVGKLAFNYSNDGKKVLIAAADTFRAAANEQLKIWADRAGVDIVQQQPGTDPGAVAYDAVSAAKSRGTDVVLIDTAGRLHTKTNLMEELKKIRRVVQKVIPEAPHEVFLVLDAVTGQNGLVQARQFLEAAGVTGIVLTKLDGTAKGGIVVAISQELSLPVKYIGVGEGIDDLQPFDRKTFVDALFSDQDSHD
ncbi:MAG: signal recognition particle-docking protein FtsY [Bacteroidetes bacterium]|nr:signal recognition particle-docking protein FtsY [Bacteroidota bacterium]MCL5034441.1 signal recognition particle-docking protein FtsY [Bacteroidota bacterium]